MQRYVRESGIRVERGDLSTCNRDLDRPRREGFGRQAGDVPRAEPPVKIDRPTGTAIGGFVTRERNEVGQRVSAARDHHCLVQPIFGAHQRIMGSRPVARSNQDVRVGTGTLGGGPPRESRQSDSFDHKRSSTGTDQEPMSTPRHHFCFGPPSSSVGLQGPGKDRGIVGESDDLGRAKHLRHDLPSYRLDEHRSSDLAETSCVLRSAEPQSKQAEKDVVYSHHQPR
jgi:hypothetical protein